MAFAAGSERPSHRSLLLREDPGAECHCDSGSPNIAAFVTDGGGGITGRFFNLTGMDGVVAKAVL